MVTTEADNTTLAYTNTLFNFNIGKQNDYFKNKKARIIRQTLFKTVFHLIDTDRKLIIPNTSLYGLKLEKVLPGANNGKEL